MKKSVIKVVFLQFLVISYGVGSTAFDQENGVLQEQQPYRTGFHFQPPKYWMNGKIKTPTFLLFFHLFLHPITHNFLFFFLGGMMH